METLALHERLKVKPFLKWAGGKTQLLAELHNQRPVKFGTYYEPFLGGGAFFFHLYSNGIAQKAVVSDSNPDLINALLAIRDNLDALLRKLRILQRHATDKAYFYDTARKRFNGIGLGNGQEEKIEKAALLLYINKTCYNGLYRVNRNGEFNVPWGGYKNPRIFDERNLRAVSAALNDRNIKVRCSDFSMVKEDAQRGDFVYFDPPYQPLSPTASFAEYTSESFGMIDQERLVKVFHELAARGCYLMLSDSPMVLQLYDGHGYRIERVKASRAINCVGTGRGAIDELLVTNY